MPPKVSVIIPTYNRARYLEEAVRSVLQQTLADLELLVVDDGSTDQTRALIEGIDDERVRWIGRPHQGIGATMNTGVAMARGDYVARLDSDDIWLPEMLANEAAVLDENPDIGLVYAKGQAMTADGGPLSFTVGLPLRFPGEDLRSMVYDDTTCNITILVRRSCLERAGPYDETLIAAEDWDLWLRVAQHCRFAFVDRVVARFRWHPQNLTSVQSPHLDEILGCRQRVLDKLFDQPDLPPAVTAMRPAAYRNVHTFTAMRYAKAGRRRKALGAAWRSLWTGCNPLLSLARTTWFLIVYEYLGPVAWAQRLAGAVSRTKKRLRSE